MSVSPCTKAAVEEGIVIGGGCTLLKLAAAVDDIKAGPYTPSLLSST
jgi:chaperonin GroEL (HSP60 family)